MEPVTELVALRTRSLYCSSHGYKQSGRRSPLPLLNANPQNGDQMKCNNQCGLKSFGHRQSLSPLRPDHSKLNRTFTFPLSIKSNPYPGADREKSIGCNHDVRIDHSELNAKSSSTGLRKTDEATNRCSIPSSYKRHQPGSLTSMRLRCNPRIHHVDLYS